MADLFLKPEHLIRDEVKMYCDTLRKWVDKKVIPHEDELDDLWDWTERKERTVVHEMFHELLIDMGLQKTFVPPPYGGVGDWSMTETGAVVMEVARGDHGLAETGFISSWAVASTMLPTPNDFMMKKLCEGLLSDEVFVICSGITEPHGGGAVEDARLKGTGTKTTAKLEKNEWVVNGHKLWPSGGREAKWFLVISRIPGEKWPNNIAQIMVPADAPGVSTSKPYRKMGCATDTNGDIWFDNVRVPKNYRLHEGEDEVTSIMAKITIGRAMATSFGLGIMRRAYELLKTYVDNREIGGVPMKDHGAIAYELGKIATNIMNMELAFWGTLQRLDKPEVYGPPWDHKQLMAASVMDNITMDCGTYVLNKCIDLMGSYGYAKEGKMEKLLRDAKICGIVVGGPVLRTMEAARYYFGTETV
jgi:alkylation response protein AidB-like acyl-CoA dehydrogenase